ncbi:sugar ABC transporter ATP-binding protein [Desulfosporosinus metallidurans]|uniref:Ribose ABC transport system, ATP-binding protein RbsA n=1 Tax=Desulfosporosinus metallidurans TaxID=1888891 RepID=A0A1Q8QV07_9FIRM|nr:sugar ABC transporter ATP-binding protein [Desulfosporosinus metallidurans]OLN31194.1 Ribose ABC transport system, ATP-binding protein RbsA [Desulfosporosinus metallidurans]
MPLLEVRELAQKFGRNYALSGISLSINSGEIHALIGENGAGKSTFIKLMTGVYQPVGGEILWQGEKVVIRNPRDARELGISVIHQDRHLVPYFTGLENLYLGADYPKRRFWPGIRWETMREEAEKIQAELGMEVPLEKQAQHMSPTERTMVEILRAVRTGCKLLFLDEPTASLTDQETETLFRLLFRLKSQGTAIIYVTHRLDEVFHLADRVTVLRNGKLAGTLIMGEAHKERLIKLMAGHEHNFSKGKKRTDIKTAPMVLQVNGLKTVDKRVKNATFSVRKGEILGVFGLAGAGRTELLEAIYGLRPKSVGEVLINGNTLPNNSPSSSLQGGIAFIPEDRRGQALIMGMSIQENITLPVLTNYTRGGVIVNSQELKVSEDWINKLRIKARGPGQSVQELSGGNQQKVVFAKALMSRPKLFLCDEPTQGVDVITRSEIHRFLRDQAEQGGAVLYVSSDLEEVLEVAHRLLVMREGETVADLPIEGLTPEAVLQLCYAKAER